MTFSDDDVKRLKEMLEPGLKGHPDTLMREVEEFFRFKADALLARLEAAEDLTNEIVSHGITIHCLACDSKIKAWRKAAGK